MSDYCEIPEFYSSKWVKAKKDHKCCECGVVIPKGEFHGVFTGKWDGEISMNRQHLECEDACRYIRDHLRGGDCLYFGELFEVAQDFETPKADAKARDFRAIMARVRYRKRKDRPPRFLGPIKLNHPMPSLDAARTRRSGN